MAAEYNVIIIGGGPAGLATRPKTLLLDSGKYRNSESKHMYTVATWDHRNPEEFRAAARADFAQYGTIAVEDAEVETVKKREDDGFF
ncbi:hypothetical protein SLS62_004273 [Diatrype stigma]|uniref:Thioredoxin reductase n=1 Tax=Diatrype stigma TaxID=117547 RepID=A0AAN9YQK7_9PEZI